MAPAMRSVPRSRRTSSFTWNGDSHASSMREPLSQWPDLESSNETSADDFSDIATDNDEDRQRQMFRGTPALKLASYESDLSDVGECDDRRGFRGSLVKVDYNSDSCLTPRSRRTLRKTLSDSTEPWPSAKPPSKAPALDTIFSPTHEILHPLQSLRLERSLSSKSTGVSNEFPTKVYRTSVTFENFTLPKLHLNSRSFDSFMEPASPKLRSTPGKFDSYTFPLTSVEYDCTVEEEKLEQKQSLIRGDSNDVDSTPLSTVNEEKSEMKIPAPNIVVVIVDAEKKLTFVALDLAIHVAVRPGDEIILLGILKHIFSPMGYKMVANTDPLYGVNREFLQLEVNKTTESFESKVSESGRREECEKKKVKLSVRIAASNRARTVVVRELRTLGATYAIFDRKLAMRSRRYYGKHLPCHAVRMRRNGRSIRTIKSLVPEKKTSSTKSRPSPITSDISSVSSSMSTDRTSSSPTLWRRIASFRSSRRSSRTTSPRSSSPVSETMQDFQDLDHRLSSKLKSLHLAEVVPADAYSYKPGMGSQGKQLATVSPAICAT